MKRFVSHFIKLLVLALISCQSHDKKIETHYKTHENLNATVWIQTSVEYQTICKQTFKMAFENIESALENKSWTALIEQAEDYENLPPAIIVDIDETILDNSPFQARLILNNLPYSDSLWHIWVNEQNAKPVPGAADFINNIKKLGVNVMFVSNRTLEEPTVANLQKVISDDITTEDVFLKKERPNWGSSKIERRTMIGKSYRILALVGDDYNDFAYLGEVTHEERIQISKKHEKNWGSKWFIIPNPTYGSFNNALWNYKYELSDPDKIKAKFNQLQVN